MSTDLFPITLDDMIAEVTDELNYRERGWAGRMRDASHALQNQLLRRMDIMRAIKRHLEQRKEIEG